MLTDEHCAPITPGTEPLDPVVVKELLTELHGWKVETGRIRKEFTFDSFRNAIAFVNRVADLAEAEAHHPDILIWYRVVTLVLTTHTVGGLSRNDFILAAKINADREQRT